MFAVLLAIEVLTYHWLESRVLESSVAHTLPNELSVARVNINILPCRADSHVTISIEISTAPTRGNACSIDEAKMPLSLANLGG